MRKTILLLLAAFIALFALAENYKVVSATRFVSKIIPRKKSVEVKNGMSLSGSDVVEIPSGGNLTIEDLDSKLIFECSKSGRIKVSTIVKDAQGDAANHGKSVIKTFAGTSQQRSGSSPTLYYKRGASRRGVDQIEESSDLQGRPSEAELDSSVNDMWTNSTLLGHIMASRLLRGDTLLTSHTPLEIKSLRNDSTGLGMRIDNTLDCPVYVNVVKVKKGENGWYANISRIGQPVCCYVILPGQTLVRSQGRAAASGERHIAVVMPYLYDIDTLVDRMNATFSDPDSAEDFSEIPLLINEL